MKKNPNIKYYILLLLGFALVITVQYNAPKPINWTESYTQQDKIPYGCFVLRDVLPHIFPKQEIENSKLPIYNLLKEQENTNYIVINNNFEADKLDTKKLLNFVEKGNNAFIAAYVFGGKIADTLNLETKGYFLYEKPDSTEEINLNIPSSIAVNFVNENLKKERGYTFGNRFSNYYFTSVDSSNCTVLGTDDNDNINFIKIKFGKGNLYLNTLPTAFTNYFITDSLNSDYAVRALSYLPNQTIIWDEYYKAGKRIVSTPMRFILSEPALKAAYLVLIFGLLIFIVFNAKRKQRIIPIVTPLKNTSLEFVDVIGTLYYQNKNHYDLAQKKVVYFLDFVRSNYLLKTTELDNRFIQNLADKSGVPKSEVTILINTFKNIKTTISEQELIRLHALIASFNEKRNS